MKSWSTINFVTGFRVVFLLGDSQDQEISTSLKNEAKKFQDILISNIPDGYNTLSYKTITGLIWIRKYNFDINFMARIFSQVFFLEIAKTQNS